MIETAEKLREAASKLLQERAVDLIIGYGAGTDPFRTTPVFITDPEEVDRLVWNPFCTNNLVKYLIDYANQPGKVAVVVKGCDSRAINRLVQDNQFDRSRIFVIGIPCGGMLEGTRAEELVNGPEAPLDFEFAGEGYIVKTGRGDFNLCKKDTFMGKCLTCENPNPVTVDLLLGEEMPVPSQPDRYAAVEAVEKLPAEQKSAYWDRQFSRCLRCYACRNVCPACTCRECIFDQAEPGWVSKRNNLSENSAFHLIRAFHVAGRCVDCGECERVCPVNIPLAKLNRKILKDMQELFAAPTPGTSPDLLPVLGGFNADDPEEFKP